MVVRESHSALWWWRALLVCTLLLTAAIPFSFFWITAWLSPRCGYYVYLEHGLICGNPHKVVTRPPKQFGSFELYQSSIYQPWRLFPEFSYDQGGPVNN